MPASCSSIGSHPTNLRHTLPALTLSGHRPGCNQHPVHGNMQQHAQRQQMVQRRQRFPAIPVVNRLGTSDLQISLQFFYRIAIDPAKSLNPFSCPNHINDRHLKHFPFTLSSIMCQIGTGPSAVPNPASGLTVSPLSVVLVILVILCYSCYSLLFFLCLSTISVYLLLPVFASPVPFCRNRSQQV